jgi:hypothetical protein
MSMSHMQVIVFYILKYRFVSQMIFKTPSSFAWFWAVHLVR